MIMDISKDGIANLLEVLRNNALITMMREHSRTFPVVHQNSCKYSKTKISVERDFLEMLLSQIYWL